MDRKLFDNVWAIRLVSFLSALMLVAFVQTENYGARRDVMQSASVEASETISNVPVSLGEHSEDIFVSGLPETVTVKITGPRNLISQITAENFRVEAQGLNGLDPGSHTIRLVAVGLPEKVTGTVTPSRTVVQIDHKETLTLPIHYEVGANAIAQGYSLKEVQLNPVEVVLTGRAETIQQVQEAVIVINPQTPINKNTRQTFALQIRDEAGQLLDVNADVYEVTVSIIVEAITSELPLKVVPHGEQEAYTYEYRLLSEGSLFVEGDLEAINQLSELEVYVDVSELSKSGKVIGSVQEIPGVRTAASEVEVEVILTAVSSESEKESSSSEEVDSNEEDEKTEETSNESESLDHSSEEINQEESITSQE